MKEREKRDQLVERFVASFEQLDDMAALKEIDQFAWELRTGEPNEFGRIKWRPLRTKADPAMLDMLYTKIPARFPPLFERLVLCYRWAKVDLRLFRLLPNPPGLDLSGLLAEMRGDSAIWQALIPAGYMQFGRGTDIDYDPVCFDIRKRTKRKDYRIVKIDHEQILCNNRIKVVAELAPSFERLMLQTIEIADDKEKGRAG